jgi:hypothetical protein
MRVEDFFAPDNVAGIVAEAGTAARDGGAKPKHLGRLLSHSPGLRATFPPESRRSQGTTCERLRCLPALSCFARSGAAGYRSRPALAGIVGARRECTALTTSVLSMPCR